MCLSGQISDGLETFGGHRSRIHQSWKQSHGIDRHRKIWSLELMGEMLSHGSSFGALGNKLLYAQGMFYHGCSLVVFNDILKIHLSLAFNDILKIHLSLAYLRWYHSLH